MKKLALNLIAIICILNPAFLFANNKDGIKLNPNDTYTIRLHVETASGDYILSEDNLERHMNAILFNEAGEFEPMIDQLQLLNNGKDLETYQGETINRFYFAINKTNEKTEGISTLSVLENHPCGNNNYCKAVFACYDQGPPPFAWVIKNSCSSNSNSYCVAYSFNPSIHFVIPCQSNSN